MGGAGRAGGIGLRMKSHGSQYPLRPRSALELFDVSFKLYKKYFWPLLGCTLLVWITTFPLCYFSLYLQFSFLAVIFVSVTEIAFFLALPLLYGASGCCVEAAIESRKVTFRDCIAYARQRYKVLLWAQILALILTILTAIILAIFATIFVLSTNANYSLNQILFILSFTLIIIFGFYAIYFFGAAALMPLVACIEFSTLRVKDLAKRCYSLFSGRARSLCLLVFTHGLGMVILYAISFVIAEELFRLTTVSFGGHMFLIGVVVMFYSILLITMLWSPFYLLSLGTFYIDTRIRKEGFDLEYQLSHPDEN